MGYAFISYSSKNQTVADAVRNLLNRNGIETWMAPYDIPVGSKYAGVINRAVKGCACFLLLLSNDSQNSEWVGKEVERAIHFQCPILPIQLEDLTLNDEFELYIGNNHIIPIRKIDESLPEIQQILNVVRTCTGGGEKVKLPEREKPPQPVKKKKSGKKPLYIKIAAAVLAAALVVTSVTIALTKRGKISAEIGDVIQFGAYEQDNDKTNGKEPIDWIVLDKQDGKALLISKYALDCQPYNEEETDVTWETCTLRTWLNGTFIENAFSEQEQGRILMSIATADKNQNPLYNVDSGNDTQDKEFALSSAEANRYFSTDASRQCTPTTYAIAQGVYTDATTADGTDSCSWWLRTPGQYQDSGANVDDYGIVNGYANVAYDHIAVRPAMWIKAGKSSSASKTSAPETAAQKQIDADVAVGDVIQFGAYEQDNDTSNGKEPIDWIVLHKQDGKALLISKYALDCQPFLNVSYSIKVTWETSSLRTWLNESFLQNAFSKQEQNYIRTTAVEDSANDNIFLLSVSEANDYFSSDTARMCAPTAYAVAQGAGNQDDRFTIEDGTATCWWWLRTPGGQNHSATFVYFSGKVDHYGKIVNGDDCAVRPAMWITLDP